ncbi:MAG: peroxiredoxin [Nitrospirae bacterium]|nr:peroxiredoxin [Nitrospirota bacterium]MBF0520223.1 peroxiredoxin [Nitrospirota bacterium]MBF0534654.1 peroxiredoxin [Nitrospirota bacterium]MBF0616302.1 peroxiredoxin [Nitrospirota bacterium]
MTQEDILDAVCCGLKTGQLVPDFTVETFEPSKGDFGEVSLEKLKAAGKWTVIVFYPADFTFVCATEFAALADLYEEFKKEGAEVITVSTDTKFVHLAWQRDEKSLANVKYPMGSDPTGNISRLFGVYNEENGLDLRGSFIISPEGTLLNSEINFYNLGRNMDELLRKLKANIYLSKHGAETCPSKWKKEGDKTLKPGAALVGKVFEALS